MLKDIFSKKLVLKTPQSYADTILRKSKKEYEMPHLKSRMKSIISCLTFVSWFSTVHASTFGIEDQLKSIEYGANPHFNASVKIVDISPFTTDDFVGCIAHPQFTVEFAHEMGFKFNQEQLVHMKECILEAGGAEKFLLTNQDKIKCETTSEFRTITVEGDIFKPQYNLSTIQVPKKKMGNASTGTIIDVQSICLPLDLQRRVFLTCTHQFRDNVRKEEITFNQLEQFVVDVACETSPKLIHRPDFKRYKIESLFYTLDQDIAFGILDTPVDEHVTPLSLIMEPLKLEEKIITVAGYGRGSVWSGNYISECAIIDEVKRAGHEIIKETVNWMTGHEIQCYPFEKKFDILEEIIPFESVPLRSDTGHSGSGGLLWNSEKKKFEIIGVLLGSVSDKCSHSPQELGIDLDPKEYNSFEIYRQALEEKILPNHEEEMIRIWDTSKDQDTVMEIVNGKIVPFSYPQIKFINTLHNDTFSDYHNKLKETFLGMKKRSQVLDGNTRFLPVSPYVNRFVEKFKELDYLKTNAKGVYKI